MDKDLPGFACRWKYTVLPSISHCHDTGPFTKHTHTHTHTRSIFDLSLTRLVRLSGGPCWCLTLQSRRLELECFMHDCFTMELAGECLKCLFRLTRGVPALVVWSEARWARIPEVQVRIPSALSFVFLWHASSDSAEVLADAWRCSPAGRSWSVSCMIVSRWSWRVSVWSVCFDWREACLPSLV